jgi:hypothetical protein
MEYQLRFNDITTGIPNHDPNPTDGRCLPTGNDKNLFYVKLATKSKMWYDGYVSYFTIPIT